MTLQLITGDRHFSSWSMRAHVILEEKKLNYTEILIELDWPMDYAGEGIDLEAEGACIAAASRVADADSSGRWKTSVTSCFPRVPLLIDDDHDVIVSDSIAIAEYLDEQFPASPRLLGVSARERAEIRNLALHVHADLGGLMHGASFGLSLRRQRDVKPTSEAEHDARWVADTVEWCLARSSGPYLFGDFSLADAMLAPIAQQIVGWDIDLGAKPAAVEYFAELRARRSVAQHLREADEPYKRIDDAEPGSPAWIAAHYRYHPAKQVLNNWQTDMYHSLRNATARDAFALAREGRTFEEIVESLSRGRPSHRDRIESDLYAFFACLHPNNTLDKTVEFDESPL